MEMVAVKKEGNPTIEGRWEIPENYECVVKKKFIDEMYGLCKPGEDGLMEAGHVSRRLRKIEEGYQHQELKKMRAAHYESMLMLAHPSESMLMQAQYDASHSGGGGGGGKS